MRKLKTMESTNDSNKNVEMEYKGFSARAVFYPGENIWHGTIHGLKGIVSFGGITVEEAEQDFRDAVDDYLSDKKEEKHGFFDDLAAQLNAAADSQAVMHYEFRKGLDYGPLLGKMTKEERKIIRGRLPVTREAADLIISKIEEYEKVLETYDLDEIVGELFFGQYVVGPWGPPEYREWEARERSLELGRPLTEEELEEFKIDFTKDDDDDNEDEP